MKIKKSSNNTDEVNEFMNRLHHPFKAEMEAVRAIITNANKKIAEHIKWGAPSFFCEGDMDKGGMATFNPRAKKCVHVVFHNGAILNDNTGYWKEIIQIDEWSIFALWKM
jgi:hypothetical protein